jgi:haloacetate dehalogenase
MSDQNNTGTRRRLLQNAAFAVGAAALVARKASGQTETKEPAWKHMFPAGFRNERIKTSGAEINTLIGGSGPPLLLLHGAPLSVISWRLVAPELAKEFTLVLCDLRGYGDSSKPPGGGDHSAYSKRPMALDGVEVMKHLGYNQFRVVGHDRGGRVARRMALDHPDKVTKLSVFDIVPAHYLYSHVNIDFVRAYFHWFDLLRAEPGPENEYKARHEARAKRPMNEVEAEYERTTSTPEAIHAMAEDYRASASIDLTIDAADIKDGKKIQCPLLVLWAATGAMGRIYDVLETWKPEGVNVTGKGIGGTHQLQESAPKEVLAELLPFLRS